MYNRFDVARYMFCCSNYFLLDIIKCHTQLLLASAGILRTLEHFVVGAVPRVREKDPCADSVTG